MDYITPALMDKKLWLESYCQLHNYKLYLFYRAVLPLTTIRLFFGSSNVLCVLIPINTYLNVKCLGFAF